ncbi:hypothetical protein TRFO_21498 [Tritrichomonas foetus]|uniref:Uncharacterized protein n=1 Tax=Tritrichomonas foetus TaxID=1144522 RepID=A0A1J4KJS3_9EUKA|nr:hypothetical protein TRFO_21498 [Tritrichomonas foetus]|eukprot:OHT09605.1 hypothetical protein TRFO_21498 [Tritrichomonas foetus]
MSRTPSQTVSARSNSTTTTSRPLRAAGTSLSNLYTLKKGPLDHIYINPTVTREGQRILAEKLYREIDAENTLHTAFVNRPQPLRGKDRAQDNAKIFNDFCVAFIDSSKETKEKVTSVISQAQNRLDELEEVRRHLAEIERQTYRFEMNLPNPYADEENDKKSDEESDSD